MQDNLIGINEQAIDKFIIEITEYADAINKMLNDANDLVTETNAYFVGENGDIFRQKFIDVTNNYHTINQNILSYAKDLVGVKARYRTGVIGIAEDIDKDVHNN